MKLGRGNKIFRGRSSLFPVHGPQIFVVQKGQFHGPNSFISRQLRNQKKRRKTGLGNTSINRATGKWGRAVSNVGDMPTAQESASIEVVKICSPAVPVPNIAPNDTIVDLYSVGHEKVTRSMCSTGIKVPFQNTLRLLGPQGEIVRVSALFDGCAMVAAMCVTVFEKVKHRLGKWKKSDRRLRMGNGTIVPSSAVWRGKMQLGRVTTEGEFEDFDSGGSWVFLLAKLILRMFRATQAYWPDTVSSRGEDKEEETLVNKLKKP